jgi:transposase
MQITTIGLDPKNVFQVHGIDGEEKVVVRKQLRRGQVMRFFQELSRCLVGLEACATAYYWARELTKLGHEVRLMPARDVKAYVKRSKNDAADAEAICEAVRRPTMRFVRVKSVEQQGAVDAASSTRSFDAPTHAADQCHARAPGRARHYGATRAGGDQAVAGDYRE